MRSRILPADAIPQPQGDDRREPSLARQAPSVARLGDNASGAKPLRAGERLAVLSSSAPATEKSTGRSILIAGGVAVVGALALVGVFTLVRFFAGL
jgi:hypothetical protein